MLYNQRVTTENKKKNLKTLETNENGNTIAQYIWDAAKAVPKGKFTVRQIYLQKQEKFELSTLNIHLKELGEEQAKPKVSSSKKIISEWN